MENNSSFKNLTTRLLLIILIVLMLLNLAYLDYVAFSNSSSPTTKESATILPTNKPSVSDINQICPNTCLSQIYEATASLKKSFPAPTPGKVVSIGNGILSQTKEFFVPFGSGSSSSGDWEDVGGLKAYVDSTQYPSIKNVVFEASVRIPTGNEVAYVRLFNETDKHPVWFSEVSLEGGTPKLLVSDPITLDQGNKLYKVQMKTSLKYSAILDQARIHITTK